MITLPQIAHQKNPCFRENCSMKHHTTLHDYFTQKKQVENEGMKAKKGKQESRKHQCECYGNTFL